VPAGANRALERPPERHRAAGVFRPGGQKAPGAADRFTRDAAAKGRDRGLQNDPGVPGARILIADDDREMRRVLRAMLRSTGAEIQEAASGQDLLGCLSQGERFDLVITDLRMPAPTGLQVIKMTRTAGNEIPFILITAFGDDEVRSALSTVPNAFVLDKPFAPPALLDCVASALNRRPFT
jgi:CheY-like chemotaxis protein